jgi:hypothetical protein
MSARIAPSAPVISRPFAVSPVKDNVLYLSESEVSIRPAAMVNGRLQALIEVFDRREVDACNPNRY